MIVVTFFKTNDGTDFYVEIYLLNYKVQSNSYVGGVVCRRNEK